MAEDPKRDSRATYLQKQGALLRQAGRHAEAHDYFVSAMRLFGADEETFLAASVAYDLAISYRDLHSGIPRENLRKAKELAERAIANKERRRDHPIRWANTWDVLGTIKRRLAGHVGTADKEMFLAEALADVKKAIKVGEDALRLQSHPIWVRGVGGFYVSLGNHYSEVGNFGEAISAYLKGMAKMEAGGDPKRDLSYQASLCEAMHNLAAARIRRGTQADLDDAMRLAGRLSRMGEMRYRTRGHMLAASALKERGGPEIIEELREHLT